jgi:hypothetical protein
MKTKTKQLNSIEALEQALLLTGGSDKRQAGEFTLQEYADRINMGVHASRRRLNAAIKEGKLTVRKTSRNFFYSIA